MKNKIGIISGFPEVYANKRFAEEAIKLGVKTSILHPLKFCLKIKENSPILFYDGNPLDIPDVFMPRAGITYYESTSRIIRFIEDIGIKIINSYQAFEIAKDKFFMLHKLAINGIPVPNSILTRDTQHLNDYINTDTEENTSDGYLFKFIRGSKGNGVIYNKEISDIKGLLSGLNCINLDGLIQKYYKEANGEDIRILIIGKEIIGSVKRKGNIGSKVSNYSAGGSVEKIEVSDEIKNIALKAANIIGLEIAGVDVILTKHGPKVIEVNSSPGFEGAEKALKKNIASKILLFACK